MPLTLLPIVNPLRAHGTRLLHGWKRLQVSYYGGSYSIHRLLALETYTQCSSLLRALSVCLVTPIPMIALVFAQESIPLQDPKDGWRANYGFWLRVMILTFVITYSSTGQAVYFIEGFTITTRRLVLLSTCVSVAFTLCTIPISAYLVFPLPFCILTMAPAFVVLQFVLFRVIMGGNVMQQLLTRREQLVKYLHFLYAQDLMVFVYPGYELAFRTAEGTKYQFLVIPLLPVIKVGIKNIVLRSVAHVEDIAPESVIFTVDFFNAIYVATCMQSSSSLLAIVALSVTDLSQTVIMLYGLHRRTIFIGKMLHQRAGRNDGGDMLNVICSWFRTPEKLRKLELSDVRIYSCFPHQLSVEDTNVLKACQMLKKTYYSKKLVKPQTSSGELPPRIFGALNAVHPLTPPLTALALPNELRSTNSISLQAVDQSKMLHNALELLFTMECLVVTAYLEAVIPFVYTVYILVMVQLSSARYHSEMTGVTLDSVGATVLPVLVFGILQIASFVVLVVMIKRSCGMQALNQLAFVLEAQRQLVQGKLMIWMLVTVCFRVVHFGVDFTFKFTGLGYNF